MPFVLQHHDSLSKEALTRALSPPPCLERPLPCFSRVKNIADKLVRARLKTQHPPTLPASHHQPIPFPPSFTKHSAPCGTPGCGCCRYMSKLEVIHGRSSHFHTAANTDCDSSGVVYLLRCERCQECKRYVGQTARTLKTRLAGHRRDFSNGKNIPLYKHVRKHGSDFSPSSLSLTVLEIVSPVSETSLLSAESKWMTRLNSRLPEGLNSKFNN